MSMSNHLLIGFNVADIIRGFLMTGCPFCFQSVLTTHQCTSSIPHILLNFSAPAYSRDINIKPHTVGWWREIRQYKTFFSSNDSSSNNSLVSQEAVLVTVLVIKECLNYWSSLRPLYHLFCLLASRFHLEIILSARLGLVQLQVICKY